MERRKKVLSALLLAVFLAAASFGQGSSAGINRTERETGEVTGDAVRGPDIRTDEDDGIEALPAEALKEASCIRRLKDAEEDLYTVVYECAEGKNTAFIFQYPVKYLDEKDEVRDISTAIRKSDSRKQTDDRELLDLRETYALSSEENR
ncbi:MAG: hypothetical protein J6Z23_00745, partial [Lachnospiraceae bacterium]|nr:hypothetical protein [Lachnospiraceae bacterium]